MLAGSADDAKLGVVDFGRPGGPVAGSEAAEIVEAVGVGFGGEDQGGAAGMGRGGAEHVGGKSWEIDGGDEKDGLAALEAVAAVLQGGFAGFGAVQLSGGAAALAGQDVYLLQGSPAVRFAARGVGVAVVGYSCVPYPLAGEFVVERFQLPG